MSAQTFSFSYDYTPALAVRLVRRELVTRYWSFFVSLGVVFCFALLCLRDRDLHWLSGFAFGFVLASILTTIRGYRAAVRAAAAYAVQPVEVSLDDHGVRLKSAAGTWEFPWSTVAAVQRIPEGLFLRQRQSVQPIPLLTESLTGEMIAFVLSRVEAAGGRVEGLTSP